MQIDPSWLLILLLSLIILVTVILWRGRKIQQLKTLLEELTFKKKSGEVLHGKAWEEFAPFMKNYPFDPGNFKFIGMPIDGLSFEEDAIYFVEIKTGQSRLSPKQQLIKNQIENGCVKWLEFRG